MSGVDTWVDGVWIGVGFLGQALFTSRFLVQWLASERQRDSVVPPAFWWLSLAGGTVLLSYAIHKADPVIIVGQGAGLFIYLRNIYLIARGRARRRSDPAGAGPGHANLPATPRPLAASRGAPKPGGRAAVSASDRG